MSKPDQKQNLKQVLLRIPDAMRDKLVEASEENGRSLTAEVLARLERTFSENESWLSKARKSPIIRMEMQMIAVEARVENRMDDLEERLAELERRVNDT
jgi:hypothetical protein